jgi:thiamine-phosphate pyrophosphorylase
MHVNHRFPVQGLYVITREIEDNLDDWLAEVAAAIRGGSAVVQYRAKSPRDPVGEAAALLDLCRSASIPLIINDDVELASMIGADGVHLGREDGTLAAARKRLGADALIGVSCYDSLERAQDAAAGGADYVAFGRFFPSATKPQAPRARLETLCAAREKLTIPLVAIGGITVDNGWPLLEAGADLLAVIEGVFSAVGGPESAASQFRRLWDESESIRACLKIT